MKYISTRDASRTQYSFLDILLGGLAPDGGLYLPEHYPQISTAQLQAWRSLSYADLAFEILQLFCDDIPKTDLKALCYKTYTAQIYPHARKSAQAREITPLTLLGTENGAPLYLQELSNGPTLAFKDMAMQLLGNLFEYALVKKNVELNILGATSGDTGSAAEYAMRGKAGIRVLMLSPHQKMSAFQTAQMFSLQDPNIINLAVRGVFDDCQDMVKAVSNDLAFKATQKIGTVNSINWARVVAQVVYYFKGFLAAQTGTQLQPVSFAVPSGNFGNICAGHIARMMGLPIKKLVLATNENNVLDEFFKTGQYRVRASSETYHTSSPSMDISKASNFERFVFDLLERDAAQTATLFAQVEKVGGFDLSKLDTKQYGFVSGASNHATRLATIQNIESTYGAVIDTHTADGVSVARQHLEKNVPMIVLETAQAAKFSETIVEALGREPKRPAGFENLEKLPQKSSVIDADVAALKTLITKTTGLV